jgi:hypothetical protein
MKSLEEVEVASCINVLLWVTSNDVENTQSRAFRLKRIANYYCTRREDELRRRGH